MQRNPELIDAILHAVESSEDAYGDKAIPLDFPDYSQEMISYHVQLLDDAELIKSTKVKSQGKGTARYSPTRLTWQGHDYVAAQVAMQAENPTTTPAPPRAYRRVSANKIF
jgi:hypothetical protein